MMLKKIVPDGWPCRLGACRPGPFVTLDHPDLLCFKSEYFHDNGKMCLALNSAGEFFHGDGMDEMVQPVEMIVEEDEQ